MRPSLFAAALILIYSQYSGSTALLKRNDFGGDFTGTSVSGSDAPGPTANTMGDKAASAMAIGTGSSGAGDYTSNYKTPNYTQYTSQDFKEFMPNYQELMESSMDKMSGMGGGTSSMGFGNFTAVGSMLKSFMELQKEQLAVEKAKTEADKAKLDFEMEYDEIDTESEDEDEDSSYKKSHRRKRSLLTLLSPGNSIIPAFGKAKTSSVASSPVARPPQPMRPYPQSLRPTMYSPINKSRPDQFNTTLSEDEKVMLKKLLGLLEAPQVQTFLGTVMSMSNTLDATSTRSARQMPSSPSDSPPPPPSSDQSSQQSQSSDDNDWKKFLSSSTSNSPTASGSGGDWGKYMSAGGSGSSWGGSKQTRTGQGSWFRDSKVSPQESASSSPSKETLPSDSSPQSFPAQPSSGATYQAPPPSSPSSSYGSAPPPQGSYAWAQGSGSQSSGSTGSNGGWLSSSQRRRRLAPSPSMSPVHGAMSIMNLPMYSSPTSNSIPNLSFSLSPTSQFGEEIPAEEDIEDEEDEKDTPVKPAVVLAVQQSPQPSYPLLNPPSYYPQSPQVLAYPPPTILQVPQYGDPAIQRESIYDIGTESLMSPSSGPIMYNGPKPMYYNSPSTKYYNSPGFAARNPTLPLTSYSSSAELLESPTPLLQQPIILTSEPQTKPLQIYRIGRSERDEEDSPISIYKITKNDKTGLDEIKKIIFDLNKGIIVSQSDRSGELTEIPDRKKRSILREEDYDDKEDDDDKDDDDFPFVRVPFFKGTEKLLKLNHHYEDDTRQRQPPPPSSSTAASTQTPQENETTKPKNKRSSGYQYQADGSDTDYDYSETPQDPEDPQEQYESRQREVKIGFDQIGELPPGSSETVSAGGGRSPGHHEGGGLTVKVKDGGSDDDDIDDDDDDEDSKVGEVRSSGSKKKQHSPGRKTLNFYFTW